MPTYRTTVNIINLFRRKMFLFNAIAIKLLLSATTTAFIINYRNLSEKCVARNDFWIHYPRFIEEANRICPIFQARDSSDDDDEDEIVDFDLSDQDWRTFRAKLVMGEGSTVKSTSQESKPAVAQVDNDEDDFDGIGSLFPSSSPEQQVNQLMQGMTALDPSQWAYDSGRVIEQGAVILGGVEQDYGFGLRQNYFHKAAILVLDHEESTFTKGIILNRPTDLTINDDINVGIKWRVWYGGDVQGFNSGNPDLVCLHSLKNDRVVEASASVMKDIKWTSFESAKKLVKAGVAKPTDFWVFCGYAGWGPGQLMGELERKSWYMVATDSQTLLKELARQGTGADPRDAGLDTWTLLMNMIGRSETVKEHTGDFSDLMLKEWARENLLSTEAGGGAEQVVDIKVTGLQVPLQSLVLNTSFGKKLNAGTLLRATPLQRSPFLLDNQELHKSIVLVISDDVSTCVGAILSRPSAKGLDIQITDKNSKASRKIQVPLRYGGQYAVKGIEPLLWLHCNAVLKAAKIGAPLGSSEGIWNCKSEDVILAIGQGLATPQDFMVVSGVLFWVKDREKDSQPTLSEKFEIVPNEKIRPIWDELIKQEVLSKTNVDSNIVIADHAWIKADSNNENVESVKDLRAPIGGLGEGFDEEDDTFVFKSDVKVSELCDDALRNWIATFLLGAPALYN